MELKRLTVRSHELCILRDGAGCWVMPALCVPALSWVNGSLVRAGLAGDTPLPAAPTGHLSKVSTTAVIPLLLPAEVATLRKQHPRDTFLMSLPTALRNLRKTPRVKAQWRAVADNVFTSLDSLEDYVRDLGGGAPGPAGAGAPAAHDHVRYMNCIWGPVGPRGGLWVVALVGLKFKFGGTAGWSQGGREIIP